MLRRCSLLPGLCLMNLVRRYPSSKWWLGKIFHPPDLTEIQELFLLKVCACGIVSSHMSWTLTWKEIEQDTNRWGRKRTTRTGMGSSEPTVPWSSWPAASAGGRCRHRRQGSSATWEAVLGPCPLCPCLISAVDTACWEPRSSRVSFIPQHTVVLASAHIAPLKVLWLKGLATSSFKAVSSSV